MLFHKVRIAQVTYALVLLFCFSLSRVFADAKASVCPVSTECIGTVSRLNASARPAADSDLHLTFALKASSLQAISSYVDSLADPSSPNFHHWLSPAEFGDRFGANQQEIKTMVEYLARQGLKNVHVNPDRLFIQVDGSRATVEAALGITINGYNRSGSEVALGEPATYYAPDRQPTVDAKVSGNLEAIFGLSNAVVNVPADRISHAEPLIGPGGSMDPPDLSKAYNISALHADGLMGQGMTIAIFSPAAFNQTDINNFLTANNIQSSNISVVSVDGGTTDLTNQDEACLDIETVVGQAPLSTIKVYEAPNNGVFGIFGQIETDEPNIVTDSWGTPEVDVNSSYATSVETVRMAMAAEGITVFNSSGDDGAYQAGSVGCLLDATSPYVTAVGGTELTLNSGAWSSEIAWTYNDGSLGSHNGSGGGLSIYYSEPSWQAGPGVSNGSSNGMRQIPDVAALASTPYYDVYVGGGQVEYGGTSASCPLWASAMSLIEQNLGSRLGNINPSLYSIGTNSASAYHDITSGNDGVYNCSSGWDFVTGWGSADFSQLLTAFGGVPTSVTSFSPSSGPVGTSMTITGTTLSNATSVTIGGVTASISSNTATQIVVSVPFGASTGTVAVTCPQGSATSGSNFTVTAGGTTSTPTISPNGGAFATSQSVTLADSQSGCSIYYTTDGSTPTVSSTLYGTPFTLSSSATVKAIAIQSGYTNSAVVSASFTIGQAVPTPLMSPSAGAYATSQTVSLSDSQVGSSIYYTTNGATPSTSSSLYSSAITVSTSETVKAMAVQSGYVNSSVASAAYTIGQSVPAPAISPAAGAYATSQTVSLSDSQAGSSIYYTTNGTAPSTSSSVYSSAIAVSTSETVKAIAVQSGYLNSSVASAAYTIGQAVPTPAISPAGGAFVSSQNVTLSDSQVGSSIYYTTNGTFPSTSSSLYSSPFTVSGSETIQAIAVENGYVNSGVASAGFTVGQSVPTPTISPNGGTFATGQSVTFSDSQVGSSIRFTTDGSAPTASSTLYTSAISVGQSETINAIALQSGYVNSAVASATFIIGSTAPAPSISPSGGTYASAQTVTLADGLFGTTIYYTVNGSIPNTSSLVYTSPINVSETETVKAIATESGYVTSSVSSATFTIETPAVTPTISPNGGTFTGTQSVTLEDSTPGATIYYTMDGSMPSISSAVYTGPISVASTETIKALAVAGGYLNSSVSSATFTITVPVIASFGAGLQLISLPESYPGVSLASIFGYSGVTLAVWNAAGLNYAVTPTAPANQIVAGQGYWVRFPRAVSVTLPGDQTPTNAPFKISLSVGWNLVGDPFPATIPFSSVTFDSGAESFAQAVDSNSPLIAASIWSYSNSSNAYQPATSLTPGVGNWVYAFTATDMDVPAPGA